MEAKSSGAAILSFADHDYRDMRPDVNNVRNMLRIVKTEFPDVSIKYAGAEEAAISLMGYGKTISPKLGIKLIGNRLFVGLQDGEIFGSQPFLAIKTREGRYYHDNLDILQPRKKWTYVFDDQTIPVVNVLKIAVGTAGRYGKNVVVAIDL